MASDKIVVINEPASSSVTVAEYDRTRVVSVPGTERISVFQGGATGGLNQLSPSPSGTFSNASITVDAFGRVTSASSNPAAPIVPFDPSGVLFVGSDGSLSTSSANLSWASDTSTLFATNIAGGTSVIANLLGSNVASIVKAASSQSVNIAEWQSRTGSVLVSISKDGYLGLGTAASKQLTISGSGSDNQGNGDVLITSSSVYGTVINLAATGTGGKTFGLLSTGSSSSTGAGFFAIYRAGAYCFTVSANAEYIASTTINAPLGQVTVKPWGASIKGVVIQAAASQSANLWEIQDGSANVLTSFNSSGQFGAFAGFADGVNIAVGTTTGTKIGTSASQKLAFFNAAPIVQPTSTTDLRTAIVLVQRELEERCGRVSYWNRAPGEPWALYTFLSHCLRVPLPCSA